MKKIIGTVIAIMLFLVLAAGCQEQEGGTETDTKTPAASEDNSANDTEQTEITDTLAPADSDKTAQTDAAAVVTTAEPADVSDTVNQIVQTAESLLGIPFATNGASPDTGFDNSGFIYYVLRENGFINCPRGASEQASMGTHTDYDSLRKGDLVYFSTDDSGQADFGGIYLGDGQMIYCPYPEENVQVVSISSDYWVNAFYIGVRLS